MYTAQCSTFSTLLIPTTKIEQFQRNQTKMKAILSSPDDAVRDALDVCKVHSRIVNLFNFINANKKD